MDARGCALLLVVVVNCICLSLVAASNQENDSQFEAYGNQLRGKALEHKLREDIERELVDVHELERQLVNHLNLITEKKRQLEIKKRAPVQCLVNIVSCWKRK